MSKRINVIIAPKDDLNLDSASIREKFNTLSSALAQQYGFEPGKYTDLLDVAYGTLPEDEYGAVARELDRHGFIMEPQRDNFNYDK